MLLKMLIHNTLFIILHGYKLVENSMNNKLELIANNAILDLLTFTKHIDFI